MRKTGLFLTVPDIPCRVSEGRILEWSMFDLAFNSAHRATASSFPSPLTAAAKTPVVLIDRCALSREGLAQRSRTGLSFHRVG